ncbi:thioredoxin domain-containing protein [Actinotalea fermentans]|uniref:Thioredoxin-like fold domain-containing protein n=1 Tax=Actinotalea fermentans TaxID=43671 RepID=A0A511Z117_9CELL|nr:thioredoxin domain-containing protein [Actinotalea fermentans]KGM16354.1 hypothetical protein N867_01140 [Actinotalea fermentans ATCC 43279 = JCM 9966 = DSM 3133]GEN81150.1 hypothetical protein AFE02nite_28840 [Actinotalea fermentans]
MSYAASKRGKVQSSQAQAARRAAEEQARREAAARRRRRALLTWGGAGLVLVIAAVVTVTQVQAAQARDRLRGPHNMMSDGLVMYGDTESIVGLVTDANGPGTDPVATGSTRFLGVADVRLFVDYTDPQPAEFWAASGEALSERMINGDVSLEIHPIGDDATSIAAAAAFGCVADKAPDSGLVAHGALLAAQDRIVAAGAEELPGVLADALVEGGVDDEAVASCIADERFRPWVEDATQRAAEVAVYPAIGPVTTSTLFILDLPYGGEPDDSEGFMAAVEAAVSQVKAEAGISDETADAQG